MRIEEAGEMVVLWLLLSNHISAQVYSGLAVESYVTLLLICAKK